MLNLILGENQAPLRKVLVLGAHCDDIEIGCGGTLLRLLQEQPGVEVRWIVFSSTKQRKKEAETGAKLFLGGAHKSRVIVRQFRDRFFPWEGAEIKEEFESIKDFAPDLVFTHYRFDLHQDHRTISDLTWNAFRNHLILEYEIPKWDGDFGSPNLFVTLTEEICRQKIGHLLQAYPSQAEKPWFTEETFRALLRLRGVECNAREKYAEGFYCRKATLAMQRL
jgi:LmbE family N-acetylglucosaminyl deacetylase